MTSPELKKVPKGFITKNPSPKGSGGVFGKKKSSAPVTSVDSGASNSYLSVLAGVSEGEIGGLVNGAQSIFLDNTPVLNTDGSPNFTGFSFDTRNGTQNQSYIPGYADSVNQEVSINTEVKYLQPISRQIINKNLDEITVRLALSLQNQDDKGNVTGTDIQFRISIKEGLNAYRVVHDINLVNKKYSSPTEFEYLIPVNNYGGTVDRFFIRVERLTPTVEAGVSAVKTIAFQAFVNSSITKLSYPNTALVGLKFEASQFTSAPEVSFELYGVLVDIPSNATINPANGSLSYVGVWDGTFKKSTIACSDPAWILWDLLTKKRYGLGRKLNVSNLNRWSFLTISKYCNELVPDGNGGVEPRFLSNFVLETAEDAYKVIETIRSIFHGMSYFMAGSVHFSLDSPGSYVAQFTQADVEEGMFSYARTGLKSLHNVAIVTWIDPSQSYTKQIETVEDYESIISDGYRPTELIAFGATTRGQARRAGLYVLYSEKLDRETVTFRCRAFASKVLPGQRIRIADSKDAEIRYGGLIRGYFTPPGSMKIFLDVPVQIIPGQIYKLAITCTDGLVYEFPVTNAPGSYDNLNLSGTMSFLPQEEGNWILYSQNILPKTYTVLNRVSVAESNQGLFEITALQHNPQKYNAIDFDYKIDPLPPRITGNILINPPVDPIIISANKFGVHPNYNFTLLASWSRPTSNGIADPFIQAYQVEYRVGLYGEWEKTKQVLKTQVEFQGLGLGTHYIRVASVDIYGKISSWVESPSFNISNIGSISKLNDRKNTDFVTLLI